MAIVPMQKIRILTTRDRVLQVTGCLQSLGVMEITQYLGNNKKKAKDGSREYEYEKAQADDIKTIEYRLAQAEFLEKFLTENISVEKNSSENVCLTEHKSYEIQHYFDWKLIEEAQNIRDKLLKIEADRKSLEQERVLLVPWRSLDMPLHSIKNTINTTVLIGKFPQISYEKFTQKLINQISYSYTHEVQITSNEVITMIIVDNNYKEKLNSILVEFGFSQISLPLRRGTSAEEIERIDRRLRKLENSEKELRDSAVKMAIANIAQTRVLVDELYNKKLRRDNAQKFGQTRTVVVIHGWVPVEQLDRVKRETLDIAPASAICKLKPKKNEMPPVIIKNNKIIEPYESVTDVYGMPLYNELDPTPWFSVFFIVFFGFCLTDAGYGIMLTLISLAVLKFAGNKLDKGAKKLMRLMVMGGISTFVLGAVFGGWFGIDAAVLPEWTQKITLIDPLANPILVLGIALALGAVHLYFGYWVRFVHLIRYKLWKESMMGQLPWLIFLTASAFWLLTSQFGIASQLTGLSLLLVQLSVILVVVGNGFKETLNPLKALPIGILSLWNIVGFVSDILSYSRLLALGLATGIIAMVINLIAHVIIDMVGPVGYVIAVFVLIGGHLFNLAINVLGAFIHSSRLQFVEFFSKFMEGGGVAFKPFKKENKWVKYEEN